MLRTALILCLVLLSACGDREAVLLSPEARDTGVVYTSFVATNRGRTEQGWFSDERSEELDYLTVDVSVPPKHKAGEIKLNLHRVDPEEHFALVSKREFNGSQEFTGALRHALAQQPKADRDVLVYVHGYNNSFADGVYRTVQMKHDFELPGVIVHYSWPSAANPLAYPYDRDSLLYSRDGLETLLRQVRAAQPGRIILVGHSLGTMLMMETLRQIEIATPGWSRRALGGAVLISPDLDIDLFKMQANRFAALPEPFAIFVSSRDRALQLSVRLNGSRKRLGSLTDPQELADYPVTLVDVSEFAKMGGTRHFTLGTSPLLIALLSKSDALNDAFGRDQAGRSGLLPGTVITAKNATQLILSPLLLLN
ncbi:putative esterase of the alpha/beta hydrolase fold protein [Thalassovita gelatinovora]|uniref:Putative esterase of the alpha/beta hydrolase fold protein n=1 Tax=Thalassovita gelatinovora TaxID=53501 RepID=A0A0P1FYR9_THAGE|nr:alpha/beta fold hydrolase [Thalassovita gelatinovora]QIZ81044.1 alpha/beta fold hydrolase [Thalassovita gelatinovora]CUH65008.1 putative esterase of the alpha/beta hydrolase fold protein [Thalassovita gelatinovora]SEP88047.1 Esterase/lipase superfamily enzyme [Thalassovita gelatinovora]